MSASPSNSPGDEPLNPAAEEKIREFCFELALALRRITGKKVDQGLEELPKIVREAIENANGTEPTHQSRRSEE